MVEKPKISFTPKQKQLVSALQSRKHDYFLFGGGAGGGKTVLGAMVMLNYALQYAGSQIGVFRREMPALKKSTYRTFVEVAKNMGLREKVHYHNQRKEMTWTFENGSIIFFIDISEKVDPDFNRVKGLELSCAFIDEANECVEGAFNILRTRVGRKNQHGGHSFIYMTCNPDQNWVKSIFYDPWRDGTLGEQFYYLQALARDNPHLSQKYIDDFDTMPEAYRERFGNGNWDYGNEDSTLFKMRYLLAALIDTPELTGRRRLGVDPAREGKDKTIYSLFDGDTLIDIHESQVSKDTEKPLLVMLADEIEEYAEKHSVPMSEVQIDTVGLGSGVRDILVSRGHAVRSFKSGFSPPEPETYGMLRDQAFYEMAQALEKSEIKIWRGLSRWEELRNQLIAHQLEITDKLIRVESKKMIKKRIGKSPDDADATVIAWWRGKQGNVYIPPRKRLPRMRF